MRFGKLSQAQLDKLVLRPAVKRSLVMKETPALGVDAATLMVEDRIITAMGSFSYAVSSQVCVTLAIAKAVNNVIAELGKPFGIMIQLLMPRNSNESTIKELMGWVSRCCEEQELTLLGGHTELCDAVNVPVVTVCAYGLERSECRDNGMKPRQEWIGNQIVMIGRVGAGITGMLATERFEELKTRYPQSYLLQAKNMLKEAVLVPVSRCELPWENLYCHDISHGGVFAALWEIGEYTDCGLEVQLAKIPIRQETVEIAEFYDVNPYMMLGTGGMLLVGDAGIPLEQMLQEQGIPAVCIGNIMANRDRIITRDDERRYLERTRGDEIYKIMCQDERMGNGNRQ